MKRSKLMKVLFIFLAFVGLCIMLFILLTPKANQNQISYNSQKYSRIDINSKSQSLNAWFVSIQEKFLHLYKEVGLVNSDNIFLNDFYTDIVKDENGYNIYKMYISTYFYTNNKLYQQTFDINSSIITSYIEEISSVGNEYNTSVYSFFQKLDNLNFTYIFDILSKNQHYHIDYVGDTTIFHKSKPSSRRFLYTSNNIFISGDMQEDKTIGTNMPVIYIFSVKEINNGEFSSTDSIGIYLNN